MTFCYSTLAVDIRLLKGDEEEECVYMCSNPLGLEPKGLKDILDRQLVKWAQM